MVVNEIPVSLNSDDAQRENASRAALEATYAENRGALLSTPIVNPPQSGILGLHTIQQRPIAEDGNVVIRPMMYIALTYDHRIVDGREAVGFLGTIKDLIEEPARLFLEL